MNCDNLFIDLGHGIDTSKINLSNGKFWKRNKNK